MRLQQNRLTRGLVLESVYRYLGISRQGMHQRIQRLRREVALMGKVEEQVMTYRRDHDRRAGSRSLYYNLDIKEQLGIGVTRFEGLMSKYGLTLRPLRVRVVTTRSVKQSWNYDNLVKGLSINGINQVVVGDLTSVLIGRLPYYVFSLTDVYSARLVGRWGSTRMRAKEAKRALDAWIELRGLKQVKGCIHHTDGGSQYFSNLYLKQLNDRKMQISVAQDCLQNGYAEQRNGLLKHHLIPTMRLEQGADLFQAELQKIDYFYNYQRKQQGLGWRTPVEYEAYTESLALQDRPVKILHDFG